jgi:2-hydroxy-3-keto-5-methylthiopentenyl-1-phosphate phosphatase
MKRQAALIDATPEQITLLLDQVKIDAHFTDFLKLCQHWKVPVQVLSDGYNFNIKTILQKNSLSHLDVAANNLAYLGQNRFEFTSLHIHDNCRSGYHACKCGKLSSGGTEILIGDGSSDFCAAHSADIVIAKDSLLAYCRKNNIPHIPFRNFSEVTHILARIFMEDQSRGNKWIPDIPMNLSYVVGEIE